MTQEKLETILPENSVNELKSKGYWFVPGGRTYIHRYSKEARESGFAFFEEWWFNGEHYIIVKQEHDSVEIQYDRKIRLPYDSEMIRTLDTPILLKESTNNYFLNWNTFDFEPDDKIYCYSVYWRMNNLGINVDFCSLSDQVNYKCKSDRDGAMVELYFALAL